MSTFDWTVETGGTLGESQELSPVQYPRSDENRGQVSKSNKGAASRTDSIPEDRAFNLDGTSNSPRRSADVNYKAGPYPVVIDEADGTDEAEGK